jgi:gamma-glutamyl hercynylcysteine S-oxide synthase
MPAAGSLTPTRRAFAELLAEARARTLMLVSSLPNEAMARRPAPELGSVLSELERIVQYEAVGLLDESLPQPSQSYDEWFDLMTDLRQRVLQRLDELDAGGSLSFPERCRMVLEHEYQRGEAILETLQAGGDLYRPAQPRRLPRGRRLADPGMMARFPGGRVQIGAPDELSVWPHEKPLHQVTIQAFWIDIMPVTNGDFMTFMGEGGYGTREFWSDDGWHWLKANQAAMPGHWSWQDGAWWSKSMGRESPIDLTGPVTHISQYEAEAFARFVGKRLPTEIEWEAAAAWDPEVQSRRNYPWGNMAPSAYVANLDQLALGPAAVGAFPGNLSPIGCYGMIGDVWEWTASDFLSYGDHEASATLPSIPYGPESRVLRGGSWATRPGAIRTTSRRPADPGDRHRFSGFRCARDA